MKNTVLCSTLAALFLVTGCAMEDTTASSVNNDSLDGETLFLGLFFGQGEAAAVLPETWKGQDQVNSEEALELSHAVVNWIANEDPAFFDRFEANMKSDNQVKVAAALDEAVSKLKPAMSAYVGEDIDTLVANSGADTDVIGTCVAVVVVAVAVGNVAAAVNAVVAGNVVYTVNWFWSAEEQLNLTEDEISLKREMMVDLLTTRLAS